jgi:hypothetical protein
MSATIKRYWHNPQLGFCELSPIYFDDEPGYISHADHLASHAYDEAKERALFRECLYPAKFVAAGLGKNPNEYELWLGWQLCATLRAKAAGCE